MCVATQHEQRRRSTERFSISTLDTGASFGILEPNEQPSHRSCQQDSVPLQELCNERLVCGAVGVSFFLGSLFVPIQTGLEDVLEVDYPRSVSPFQVAEP